jgi:hypothetical protein
MSDRFVFDENDPDLALTTGGTFGGPDDREDNGRFAFGGGSTLPDGSINPEPYASFPEEMYRSGKVQPGQTYTVVNPANQKSAIVIARDIGPSAKDRGIDVAPHVMDALGADTDQPLLVDFNASRTPDLTPEAAGGTEAPGPLLALGNNDPFKAKLAQDLANAPLSAGPVSAEAASQIVQNQESTPDLSDNGGGDDGDNAAADLTAQSIINEPDEQAATTANEAIEYPVAAHPDGLQAKEEAPDGSWVKFNDGSVLDKRDGSVTYKGRDGSTWRLFPNQPRPIKVSAGPKAPKIVTDQKTGRQYDVTDPQHPKEIKFPANKSDLQEGARGEAALTGLSEGKKEEVRALTSYKMNIQAIPARGFQREELLNRAYAYDPSFDMSNYANRQKVMQSFKAGKDADNIKSINTAINHLNELGQAVSQLHNRPDKLSNFIVNNYKNVSGDPTITKFQTTATAVENELANVFKNTGATEGEIHQWRQNFSKYGSPAQLKEGINEAINLMAGRMDALKNKYQEGIGKPADFDILSPQAKTILTKLGRGDVAEMGGAETGGAESPAQQSSSLQVNKWYQDASGNWGQYLGNGHWRSP